MPVAERDWSAQSTAGVVETNEDHLRAALDGLVENAIAFTQNGDGISVHARRSPDSLTIEVSDTGAGIAPDHLDHIFERSWTSRGRPANGRSGGTGLGLAIVRTAVETLGGTIRVRSVVGGGTTFTLDFPQRRASTSELRLPAQRPGESDLPAPA